MATVPIILDARSAEVEPTAVPELITDTAPNGGYAFDASTTEIVYHKLTALSYGSGNLTLVVKWYSRAAATSGSVAWATEIAASSPGDTTAMTAKTFDAAQSTVTAVNTTAGGPTATSITITNLDSLAADDELWIKIYRDTANGSDTLSGDAVYTSGYLTYSD